MTPLQIQMLLHYHCSPAPFQPWGNAQSEARDMFREQGLICEFEGDGVARLTGRGRAYVEFLCAMPLPLERWSMDMESFTSWLEKQPRKILEIRHSIPSKYQERQS